MARVLIIEDNDMLNQAYTFMLQRRGHSVKSTFNGEDGLTQAEQFDPQIILLDYSMPKMDGAEFLRRYNPRQRPGVKVLMLSNISEKDKISLAYDLGVYKYLLKAHTQPAELVGTIDDIMTPAP